MSITELARANIHIQSGIRAAEVALAEAEYQLSLAHLYAPFSGRAADVKVQAGARVGPGEEICTLTDPNSLEVEFSLLEQELASTQVQSKVFVSPVANPELRLPATLDILNPKVGPGGLLRVRARLRNYAKARLYPGYERYRYAGNACPTCHPPAQICCSWNAPAAPSSLPTTAESGRAKWLYVTVGFENDELMGVVEGLEVGQSIAIEGNFTPDHDSRVRVVED